MSSTTSSLAAGRQRWILISAIPGTLVFRGGFNDFFGNGAADVLDGQPAGPGNLKLDPGYVDRAAKNFRLQPNSPLINKGITCSPGRRGEPRRREAAARRRSRRSTRRLRDQRQSHHRRRAPRSRRGRHAERDERPGHHLRLSQRGRAEGAAAAPDDVDGGGGNDRVFGGSGVDRVRGGLGNDTLCTRDATSGDVADGGAGSDKADTDPGDIRVSIETSGVPPSPPQPSAGCGRATFGVHVGRWTIGDNRCGSSPDECRTQPHVPIRLGSIGERSMHSRPTLACLPIALAALLVQAATQAVAPPRFEWTARCRSTTRSRPPIGRRRNGTCPRELDWNGGFIATWLNYRSATDRRAYVGFFSDRRRPDLPGTEAAGLRRAGRRRESRRRARAGRVSPTGRRLIFFVVRPRAGRPPPRTATSLRSA